MRDLLSCIAGITVTFGIVSLFFAWQIILPVIGLLWLVGWLG
ncbi:hypothetical protein [Microvirga lotononidis]|uniref:Uncharacterized protein n=1 Tax=Microvirga lotononidis TaxID=864069 RepID=I4YP35_9HYPH|nr:hypothetical protein [Microvirga lotononidis]EIM25727.1 hypothetical protein MicloDRAFT_00064540 [Microvirga lotononidis]WQO25661.1 hypothetical protein U0023_13135 [Microvirga lotononidis]